MPTQHYFAKTVGAGTRSDPWRPDGVDELVAAGWGHSDHVDRQYWEREPPTWWLVRLRDVPQAVLNSYDARVDTRAIPRNLSNTINVSSVVSVLDEMGMPSQWPTASMTYRQVLKVVWQFIQLDKQVRVQTGKNLLQNLTTETLATPWQDLPAAFRTGIRDAADALGLDYSAVVATDTLRIALWKTAQATPMDPWGEAGF